MRVLRSNIHVQTPEKLTSNAILWQHASYGMLNESFWKFCLDHVRGGLTLTAIITRVCEEHTVRPLLAGHLDQ